MYKKPIKLVSHKYFLVFILALATIQGLWYAINFQPTIFDEGRHYGFISMYTERGSPFISEQDTQWDYLGETTRAINYFYYFVLSLPLKVIKGFTGSLFIRVLVLRLLHITMFIAALVVYHKALLKLGFSKPIVNMSLLLLVLTPAIAPIAGVISYDIPVFLFSGLLLLHAASFLKSTRTSVPKILLFIATLLFGSLFKYTFMAFALPVTLFVLWDFVKQRKYKNLSVNTNSRITIPLMILCLIGLGLFIERPLKNFIVYGDIKPSCIELHGAERCQNNYVFQRNLRALGDKPEDFVPKSLYLFAVSDWVPNMIRSQVRLNPWDNIISPLYILYSLGFFFGVFLFIYKLDTITSNKNLLLSLITIVVLSLVLMAVNYKSYVKLGEVVATSSRYLLPAQLLFFALILHLLHLSKKYIRVGAILVFSLLIVVGMYKGGGIITYAKKAPDNVKWSSR